MSEPTDVLARLPVLSVAAALDAVVSVAERARRDPQTNAPMVTLLLRGGRELRGWILGAATDRLGAGTLMIRPAGHERFPPMDVIYLDRGTVEGVWVHDAETHAHWLSGGEVRTRPSGPAPSKLELKRLASDAGNAIAAAVGHPISVELPAELEVDQTRYVLAQLLRQTSDVLRALAEETLGKAALGALEKVVLGNGDLRASRDGTALRVTTPLAGEAPDSASVKAAIEAAL